MHLVPLSLDNNWWTEARAGWAEAFALILIFLLDLGLGYLALQERREAREDRKDARDERREASREREELRYERRQAEIARQRSDVTCGGVTSILRSLTEEQLCLNLWASNFKQAGFAFEKTLYGQLPEYLMRKCDQHKDEIGRAMTPEQHKTARFLLVFRLPYPNFDAVLEDINRLNFGNTHVVWDDDGNPLKVLRG